MPGFGVEEVVSSTTVCRTEAVVVAAWAAADVVTGGTLVVTLPVELVGEGRARGTPEASKQVMLLSELSNFHRECASQLGAWGGKLREEGHGEAS